MVQEVLADLKSKLMLTRTTQLTLIFMVLYLSQKKTELLNMLQKKLVPSQRQGYKEYRLKIKLIPSAMAAQDNDNDANKKLFVQFN